MCWIRATYSNYNYVWWLWRLKRIITRANISGMIVLQVYSSTHLLFTFWEWTCILNFPVFLFWGIMFDCIKFSTIKFYNFHFYCRQSLWGNYERASPLHWSSFWGQHIKILLGLLIMGRLGSEGWTAFGSFGLVAVCLESCEVQYSLELQQLSSAMGW